MTRRAAQADRRPERHETAQDQTLMTRERAVTRQAKGVPKVKTAGIIDLGIMGSAIAVYEVLEAWAKPCAGGIKK